MACSTNQKPSIYFEDDAVLMNRMIETYGQAIQARTLSTYELDDVQKAIKSIARLIQSKADRQMNILNTTPLPTEE